jgi:hypothetical protein
MDIQPHRFEAVFRSCEFPGEVGDDDLELGGQGGGIRMGEARRVHSGEIRESRNMEGSGSTRRVFMDPESSPR